MAEVTNDTPSIRLAGDQSQPSVQDMEPADVPRYMRGHLSRPYDEYDVHQQIQIERETLGFLKKCRKFKRPPQSIRISGANAVKESEKLILFSEFETRLLEHQISCKDKLLKELSTQAKDEPYTKLPRVDRRKLHKHYKKKIKFYSLQDDTKWQQWPKKVATPTNKKDKEAKKTRNFKKKAKTTNTEDKARCRKST